MLLKYEFSDSSQLSGDGICLGLEAPVCYTKGDSTVTAAVIADPTRILLPEKDGPFTIVMPLLPDLDICCAAYLVKCYLESGRFPKKTDLLCDYIGRVSRRELLPSVDSVYTLLFVFTAAGVFARRRDIQARSLQLLHKSERLFKKAVLTLSIDENCDLATYPLVKDDNGFNTEIGAASEDYAKFLNDIDFSKSGAYEFSAVLPKTDGTAFDGRVLVFPASPVCANSVFWAELSGYSLVLEQGRCRSSFDIGLQYIADAFSSCGIVRADDEQISFDFDIIHAENCLKAGKVSDMASLTLFLPFAGGYNPSRHGFKRVDGRYVRDNAELLFGYNCGIIAADIPVETGLYCTAIARMLSRQAAELISDPFTALPWLDFTPLKPCAGIYIDSPLCTLIMPEGTDCHGDAMYRFGDGFVAYGSKNADFIRLYADMLLRRRWLDAAESLIDTLKPASPALCRLNKEFLAVSSMDSLMCTAAAPYEMERRLNRLSERFQLADCYIKLRTNTLALWTFALLLPAALILLIFTIGIVELPPLFSGNPGALWWLAVVAVYTAAVFGLLFVDKTRKK